MDPFAVPYDTVIPTCVFSKICLFLHHRGMCIASVQHVASLKHVVLLLSSCHACTVLLYREAKLSRT